MKRSTKITIAVLLFFVLQGLVTAEKYYFKGTDGYYRKIDICPRKLIDSQKDGMTIGKDHYEEKVLELFQKQKGKYSHGSRVSSKEHAFYFYDYDKETDTLITYVKVCKPEPYEFKYLGDIARQISEIEVTEETVKEDILDTLKKVNK